MSESIIISGKEVSKKVRAELLLRVESLREKGIIPQLAVVIVGDDPASKIYVRNKARAFENMGLASETFNLSEDVGENTVLSLVNNLNDDKRFHGILVQLPLPKQLDSKKILMSINPDKDADGLHPMNIGKMVLGIEAPLPCTPHGILMLLKYYGLTTVGKHVVVLGRSDIVGKPVANLLLQRSELGNATVTVCHTKTRNIKEIARQADILIVAIGKAEFVDGSFLKRDVVVIDVGVNRVEDVNSEGDYKLVGDVKFNDAKEIASAITPVPGGVGPMTITMLISNTIFLAEKFAAKK
jgi:methylenetetrahydrofolate dehydrogenase (NADP+)/methenyltetrahydrofolate cyclohydrolase